MLDVLQWSSVLLALLGLFLWLWSGGMRVPQAAAGAHQVVRLKRQIRRVAISAAIASALLQAAGASASTERLDVQLWASAVLAPASHTG